MPEAVKRRIAAIVEEVFHQAPAWETVRSLKQGMTNDSFYFELSQEGQGYVLRLNGAGTEQLIDRPCELAAYRAVEPLGLSEQLVAVDIAAGYKISQYIGGAHTCDAMNPQEVARCMACLRRLHVARLPFAKRFDIAGQIDFYEHLADGAAMPENYSQVKAAVLALRPVQELPREVSCLCHIDAVPDNFLLQEGGRIYLLDWEYASASVPLMDVAMFAIYAGYDREETNALLATYLGRAAQCRERARCYAYMAAGGLLWSNWCVYKEQLGETFGSYAARQYAYARLCPAWVREEETSCSQ